MALLLGLLSCESKKIKDFYLEGGYMLSRYESAVDDKFYIMDPGQTIVIPSRIEEICLNSQWITGRVKDLGVLAMPRVPSGYFIIDTKTRNVTTGLTKQELAERLPGVMHMVAPQEWTSQMKRK
ncbi:MAG: hypothetical protein ACOYM3_27590 [Terrimicrobiaceae bacterium]